MIFFESEIEQIALELLRDENGYTVLLRSRPVGRRIPRARAIPK